MADITAEEKEKKEQEKREKARLNKEKRLIEARGVWRDEIIPQWEKLYTLPAGVMR
jgi:hypothetical protein